MSIPAELPGEVEASPFADLIADAAVVARLLDRGAAPVELPEQRRLVIPERAQAVVAGLDSYGD